MKRRKPSEKARKAFGKKKERKRKNHITEGSSPHHER